MEKRYFVLLILLFLFSNLIGAFAANSTEILPVQTIEFFAQPGYENNGTDMTNVTYVAYTKGIRDGSVIDFYSGNPKAPYPTNLLGSSRVKEGKAYIKVFQKPDTYFIGSAVYTLPIDLWPPTRVYSNIATYYIPLSGAVINIDVGINNRSKSNVTYTAKFSNIFDSSPIADKEDISTGKSVKVRFITYEIPEDMDIVDVKTLKETRLALREDYAVITDWAAQLQFYLKPGSYIVYADCTEITASSNLMKFTVPN